MIDLTTCVKGQKLRLRNEDIVEYSGPYHCFDNKYNHVAYRNLTRVTYTDSGSYFDDCCVEMRDVIEILPLETIEPTKSDKHPSVAWWESCPWITDRRPTEADGNYMSQVLVHLSTQQEPKGILSFMSWKIVRSDEAWIHCMNWNPPVLFNKEKAIEMIDKHKEGWTPTFDEWLIISNGLKE